MLRKFIFIPYLAHIDVEMEKRILLEKHTAQANLLLEEAESEKKSLIEAAKIESTEIRKTARELAKDESTKIIARAEAEAQSLKDQAVAENEALKMQIERDMKSRILSVAIKLNEKLFQDSSKNTALLETYSKQL